MNKKNFIFMTVCTFFLCFGASAEAARWKVPTVTTGSATSISATGATLNGSVNPNGSSTSAYFQYGTTTSYGYATASLSEGSGSSSVAFSQAVSGLNCNATYHYRAVGTNSGGTSYGSDTTFTTGACTVSAPTVTTSSASGISATGATLNGSVNPNGSSTSAYFQYGTTTSYGYATASQSEGSGSSSVAFSQVVSGLTCNATYHYRSVGNNGGGTSYGSDMTFTTSACTVSGPTVTTSSATSISATGATLNGSVNPNGSSTSAYFQYGTTTSYGYGTGPQSLGSGTSSVSISGIIPLTCNATYHYRAVASNSRGTSYGSDMTFTTSSCSVSRPTVTTSSATSISATGATLNGSVNPNGSSTTAYFQYGTTTSYGYTTASLSEGSGTSTVSISQSMGVTCNTTYHYRAVGTNSGGTSYGSDLTFTTSACTVSAATVTTNSATGITATGALLNGTVNPNGSSTSAYFQYGTTTSYGYTTASLSSGSGTSSVSISLNISGITCNATYHYRAVATNSGGTSYGSDMTFTTGACTVSAPTVTTSSATGISATGATLNGTVNPNGSSTTAYFQYGPTTSYGSTTSSQGEGSGSSSVALSQAISGLTCNATYHYRAVGTNSGGTSYGSDLTLTTSACPVSAGDWVKQFGSLKGEDSQAVAIDHQGNIILTGEFTGTVDFGGGPLTGSAYGKTSVFVAKFSPTGNYLWAKTFPAGEFGNNYGNGIAVDSLNNIIITGNFSDTINFGGGKLYGHNFSAPMDSFIAKLSPAGNYLWAKSFGSADGVTSHVAVDSTDNVVATGQLTDTIDFGGGSLTSNGLRDIFLVKYSASGTHLWSKNLGGAGSDVGNAIAIDSGGNLLVTGYFQGTANLGSGTLTSAGSLDAFVAKFSSAGSCLWSRGFGGTSLDFGNSVAVDNSGNVMVTGYFQGTADFGGGALTSAGGQDIFVAKYGPTGNHMWSKRFGGSGDDQGVSIAADGNGNVLVTGNYQQSTIDLGGGPLLPSTFYSNFFAAKLSPTGSHLWSGGFGDYNYNYSEAASAITAGSGGNALVTGYFQDIVDFDGTILTSAGSTDIFLLSIAP